MSVMSESGREILRTNAALRMTTETQCAEVDFAPGAEDSEPKTRLKMAPTARSWRCKSKVCARAFWSIYLRMLVSAAMRSLKLVSDSQAAMAWPCTHL